MPMKKNARLGPEQICELHIRKYIQPLARKLGNKAWNGSPQEIAKIVGDLKEIADFLTNEQRP